MLHRPFWVGAALPKLVKVAPSCYSNLNRKAGRLDHNEFKEIRTKLGLKPSQLAIILDQTETTVRRYEMKPDKSNHRSVSGPVARIMTWLRDGYRPPEWPKS